MTFTEDKISAIQTTQLPTTTKNAKHINFLHIDKPTIIEAFSYIIFQLKPQWMVTLQSRASQTLKRHVHVVLQAVYV